ncbi:hypothetical protein CASFOL_014217 [Castilleja foliolosa]|uniref:NAC domain-containing protein n=1 Tax=Castilleja foliolosa TaxID=1961234 RepID=A0ABD3DP37_9LAMI
MNSTSSSASVSHHSRLPPGFRFHPTDEELVVHYLKKKAAGDPLPAAIITEINLYKYDPWELPGKANFGEQEWYFFSPRERKYPNGERPNRAATSGYWKATGTDKPIMTCNGAQRVGVKKALVFYGGKPPKGLKTNWIMHEYRLVDNTNKPPGLNSSKKNSSRLDDWVLCRIFKKRDSVNRPMDENTSISRPVLSIDEYQSSIQGRNCDLYSGGNNIGSAITSLNPTQISPFSSMFTSNDDEDDNPGNSPSDKNSSFISLLNDQQYEQTMCNQNSSLVNYSTEEGNGMLNQSYQLLSDSQFEINN